MEATDLHGLIMSDAVVLESGGVPIYSMSPWHPALFLNQRGKGGDERCRRPLSDGLTRGERRHHKEERETEDRPDINMQR